MSGRTFTTKNKAKALSVLGARIHAAEMANVNRPKRLPVVTCWGVAIAGP